MNCKLFNLLKRSVPFLSIFTGMMFISSLAHAGVDLVVNHSDSPDPVSAGGVVTYTISVSNNGDTNSPTSTLTVTIPATTSYVSDSSGDGVTCTGPVGNDLTCDFGSLAGFPTNEEKTVAIQLLTSSEGIVTVGAVAATSGAGADDTPANNTDNETTTINKGANVALVKSASTLNAPSGSALTYSFAITNNGPDSATLLRVQDPIPAGFSLVSLPSECSNSGGTIICDIDGPIANGDTLNIGSISGVITAAGSSTLTNAASIGLQPTAPLGTPNDPDTSDNSSTVDTTVTGGSDVSITKSRSVGGSILVGTDFNFVLSTSYSGDNPADLTVTDTIPANYTIDSGSFLASQNGWSCALAGQDVTCTRALGGAGTGYNQAIGDITIPVTVATSGNNVTNSATIATTSTDPVPGNNTATDGGVNLLDPTVNLGINKTGPDPALVVTGVEFDFYVRVNNTGTTGFYGTATITDNIPANMTVNSYTLNGWSCAPAAPVVGPATITCNRIYTSGSQLAAGANSPYVIMTAETATDGNFTNSATVTTPNCNLAECNDGDLDTYQVISSVNLDSADVRVLKTVDPATVLASDILTYTLEVVNDGPATSADVLLTDTFSNLINNSVGATGAGYIDAVTTNGTATLDSCSDSASGSTGRSLSCVYTSVPVCTASVDCPVVTVRVRPGGNGGARSNTANVISNGTADPDHSNDSATANNTVTPRADIEVAKAATPASVAAGQNLTYVVTVSNNGPSRAEGVTMTDTLPHDVTFVSATPSAGTCGTTPTAESTTTGGNDSIVCAIGTINNGSQQTVTIVVRPNTATRGGDITNTASAVTTTLETDGPANTVNANNSDSVDATILVPSLDLVLNKDDSVDPVAVGDQTVYTITVTNSGPSAAEGVSVTDTLPATGLSFVSATSSAGSCPTQPAVGDDSGANVICNLGYISSSSQETVTITLQGKVKGVYTNTATVTSNETGLGYENAANNSATELTTVRTKADMEVTSKVASPASVDLRDNFTFTIKIKNLTGAGLSEADNVEVSDTLPTDMELTGAPTVGAPASGSVSLSTCTGGAGDTSFTCSLGTVVTNTEVDITVPVQLVKVTTKPQTFTNTASVTTSSLDVDLGNNSNTGDVDVNSSSVAGTVFRDFNNNGAVTAGDTGISGITITLTGTSFDGAAVSETTTTDGSGDFIFTGLPESDGTGYTIVEGAVSESYLNDGTDTAGTSGGNAAAVNDQISAIVLAANTAATGYLFAEVPQARIGIAKRVQSGPTIQADGTFLTNFRLNIENFSLEQINNIVVTDSLNGVAPAFGTYVAGGAGASLSTGEYTIQTAPSGGCGGTNAAYNGNGDNTVATVVSLASTTSCTLDFAVRARPTAPLPAAQPSGGTYENQASITGTGDLSGQSPSDTSDNGSNPDPTNNDTAGDAGESDPTPIAPSYTPAIGIAKTTQGGITVEANESITVPIRLVVENLGDEPLNTISITDTLTGVAPKFGTYVAGGGGASLSPGDYTIQSAPAFNGACTNGTANAAFNGNGDTVVATITGHDIGATCSIDFTFRFMPLASTTYENQASVSAIGDYTTGAASDTSDNGTNPDPDGDSDPDEAGENDPTPISYPRIGLAKRVVGSSTTNNDGTVTVPFSFVVTNLGGEALNSVVISDDLSGASPQFGSYVAGGSGATLAATEYTINSAPAFSGACLGGTLTPGYNGDGTPSMASITGFASGASCTILTTIRFRPGAPLPAGNNFTNQATVAATGAVSAIDVTDLSDDGTSPDTDGDGIGNEAGENDPTLVNTTFTKQISLTKTFSVAQSINADGSINAPFRVKVLNSGTEPLITLTVTDNLEGVAPAFGTYVAGGAAANLSRGEYTIQTAPAFNGACTNGTLTAAYTGDAQDELASLTRLEVLDSCEIDFTVRFLPTSPLPGGGYSNSASTQGTGEFSGGAPVTDISQNGIDPDPNGNDDPTDDNDPTPVSTIYTPSIGVAKALQGSLTVNGNDTYTGTFRIVVENLGNEELATVSVSDAMNSAPSNLGTYVAGGAGASLSPGQYTIESAPAFNGVCTNGTANAAFDGEGDPVLATITELDTETSCSIDYDFRFMPEASTSYLNRATAQGTGVYSTTVVTDQSDNGANPDPDGDGDADESGENDATPVPYPRIGLAKRVVGSSTTNANGTVTVPFSFVVTNLGGEDLTVSAITDDLSGASPQFGSYVAGGAAATLAATEYTIETAPAFSGACAGGTLTPGYDGDATPSLASITSFASGASCTITTTIRFRPGAPLPGGGNFTNQASVAATGDESGLAATDLSDDGVAPDTDGDGVGNEAGENDPTPVGASFTPRIALAKRVVGSETVNANGTITVPFRIAVSNNGTEPLTTITVSDDLSGVAPAFGTYVAGGGAANLDRGEYTVETAPAFNGACATGTLTAAYTGDAQAQLASLTRLEVQDSCEINFTLRFKPTSPLPGGGYSNQASTSGTGELSGGAPVTDLSQDGLDPDPDSDDDATDNNVPTPVSPSHTPSIGIAKTLLNGQILNTNGSYSGTFRLVVENLGDEELQTVSVSDAMDTAPANLGTFVAGGAGATLSAGQYTIESAPAFVGVCTNGTANAAFNGEGTPVVATITELATGTSCTVEYDFRFVPEPGINYFNQATTQGTGAYSTGVVNDTSDDGTEPDTDGDNDADEAGENDATPIPYPRVGLAKRVVGSTTTNADGSVLVPLSFVVTNLGGETLNTVGISDDLSGASPQFGSYVAGGAAATLAATEYTIQTAPAFSGACAGGTIDPAYDGDTNGSIASITSLTSGSSCTITMTIRFRPGTPLPAGGNFTNQAGVAATGASSAIGVTDLSDDGTDPDSDNDGVGNEPGENDPTPVNVSFTPQVGLTKTKTTAETINANGTVTVPFRLAVSNSGDEPLINVTISDDLAGVAPAFGTYVAGGAGATLDKGEYTIETAPAFNGACATGTLTAAYDGDTQDELASLTRLEIAASCEIDFTLRFKPTSPLPGGGYSNQGSTQATGELSTTVVTDLSQNGVNPDPDSNDDPTDNSDPTPVGTSHSSAIGIAKSLQNGQILNTNGSYSGTFRLVVENLGNEELQTVSVSDAMNSAPSNLGTFVAGGAGATLTAGQYTIESAPAFVGVCTNGSANAAFNGEGTPVVATITELDTGSSCTVEYDFRFVPQAGTNYFNQATTQGTGAYSAGVVTDTSDDGTDPDTDGDMDADEAGENDPTPIPYPRIGLAKRLVGSTTTNVDGTVTAALSFVVTNLGGEDLSNVGVTDDLSGASPQFGSYVAGGAAATLVANQYTVQTAPAFSGACANGTIDPAYDGDTTASVASITSLTSGSSCTITMTIRFRPGAPLPAGGNFINQATVAATGASSAIDITDLSDDGTDPDTDNDGVGNEAGENDPTPINVSFTPQVGLTKRLTAVETTNANGTITVPFRLAVSNSGDEPLISVSISDDLSGVAPAFGTYVAGGAAADLDKGEYTVETAPAFNGACANGTITAGYTGDAQPQLASLTRLEIAASCEIDFTLRFKPTSPLPAGGYSNQGSTQATGELSTTVVTDLSQDGTNPDPDSNDDPTDNNVPTPVSTVHAAAIGIAKTLNSGLVVNTNGSYSGTFRIVVENLGNEELQSVSIIDAMNTAPSNLGTFVAGGASATLTAGQYTIESAPAFVGACANGTANAAFTGTADPIVATITELDTATSCTVDFGFRFMPTPGSTYLNQATTQGTGAYSTTVVNDLSDDGTDPDPSGNGDATEAGENDPTPIPIPRIGLAKSAAAVVNNGDGTYDVPFTLTLINAGELALSNIQITDDLSEFGSYTSAAIPAAGQYTISSDPVQANPANGAALTPVGAGVFTGTTGGYNLLDAASSELPNFGSGSESSAQINFTVRFFPTTPGPFNNSAVTTATSSSGGDVTDDSVTGDTPDADGNGDPGDDTSPTVVNLSGQDIGVAKAVSGIVQTGAKSYTIPYTLIIANLDAATTLTNVQLTDNLAATFPTAQSMSISTAAAVSACTGTVLNVASPAFDGVSQIRLLAGNQNLQPGEQCTVTFTVAIDFGTNPLPSTVQNNSATGSAAQTPGGIQIAADLSDNGSDPDTNDNGYGGDTGESDPTPVDFRSGSLSSVSGKVWHDTNHDRVDNDNSTTTIPTFIVEVINSAGTILGTTTTDEAGEYNVGGLFPSTNGDAATHYKVRFRESESGAVYGNPLSQDPVNPNGTIVDGIIADLELVTGTNTVQQDLPLDPSGVVYDSVTRSPVPDATVVFTGPAGFDPALHLVGGAGNQTQVTGASGFYQYILLAGAPSGTYTLDVTPPPAYVPTPSSIIPACTNTPTVVAVPSPALVQNSADAPVQGITIHDPASCPATSAGFAASADTTQFYYSFDLTVGTSGDVVNNHIPVDPVLGGAITLVKSSPLVNVSIGQLVPYTISATNTLAANLSNIDIRDTMPPGFKYKVGSASIDGITTAPTINGRVLSWNNLVFPPNGSRSIKLLLVVGSGVQPGEYINQARAYNNLVPEPGNAVSNLATATVRVIPDPVFDCSDLIGKVFDDQNANGYQDEGEPPIPNVRLATVRGLLVTTDAEGRFHVTCAMVPNEFRGSNFIMKLDERTLPSGYRLTTENPRVVHLTRGKMSKLNFGAAIHRVVRLELTAAAFISEQSDPSPEFAQALDTLPEQLRAAPSVIRLAYNRNNEADGLIKDRLQTVRKRIEKLWEEQGCCYDMIFEEEIFQRNLKAEGGAQ